ncbi:uncharacterized protein LOC115634385 [Scaptodrosophila lebanonensis]|uniref:Uncharacterized protein LOC115634385 n=1 Tax=Drosophila lebanonensis TaxID=7225 RepID=A0A6J2UID0_DROLE|nr:uncharacterized protein LOC115634385 [Scaptodrosophila lebanonensis]
MRLSLVSLGIAVLLLCVLSAAERNWEYEPKSITSTSADEEKVKLHFQIDRVNRGEYALTGNIEWKYDTSDDTMIEVFIYRSPTGSNYDYRLTPWSVPKQKYHDYINTLYKEFVKNFSNCSNLPVYKDNFKPPWPKNKYEFKRCEVAGAGLPEVLPEGFYKLVAAMSGEVDWGLTIILKITTKMT